MKLVRDVRNVLSVEDISAIVDRLLATRLNKLGSGYMDHTLETGTLLTLRPSLVGTQVSDDPFKTSSELIPMTLPEYVSTVTSFADIFVAVRDVNPLTVLIEAAVPVRIPVLIVLALNALA
jgi:hypothetical protein